MRAALVALCLSLAWPAAAQPVPQPVPQPVAPAPAPQADPDPDTVTDSIGRAPTPDPDTATPDPDTATPDPDTATPDPDTATPDPAAPIPDPDADPDADADLDPGTDLEPEPESEDPELPAEHQPRLELRVSPESGLMTGDVLTLELRVDALAGDDIAVPQDQEFGIFEVLDRGRSSRVENGDRTTHVFELELLALEPGPTEIPPIRVRVVTADQVVGEVETEALPVEVGSVLGNEPDAQPKPPTQPVEVWQDDDTLWWVLGALGLILFTALATLLFARWWRRRKKAEAPPPPPRPAEEIALEKLEELRRERDRMLEVGEGEAWVDGVSDAVREYFGHRYGFEGLESTSDEVIAALRTRKVRGISIDEVQALLSDCDLVKFARADATAEQTEQMLAGAFRLVRATTPRPGAGPTPNAEPSVEPTEATEGKATRAPEPTDEDARWMPKAAPPPAAEPETLESASAPEEPKSEADRWMPKTDASEAAPTSAEPEAEPAGDDRWMPKADAAAPQPEVKSRPAEIPKTMETPSPLRPADIPKTTETPSPVRKDIPATSEGPSPMRPQADEGDTLETPSPVLEEIPSTLPGTDRLIPKTSPPPARDTDPDEEPPSGEAPS